MVFFNKVILIMLFFYCSDSIFCADKNEGDETTKNSEATENNRFIVIPVEDPKYDCDLIKEEEQDSHQAGYSNPNFINEFYLDSEEDSQSTIRSLPAISYSKAFTKNYNVYKTVDANTFKKKNVEIPISTIQYLIKHSLDSKQADNNNTPENNQQSLQNIPNPFNGSEIKNIEHTSTSSIHITPEESSEQIYSNENEYNASKNQNLISESSNFLHTRHKSKSFNNVETEDKEEYNNTYSSLPLDYKINITNKTHIFKKNRKPSTNQRNELNSFYIQPNDTDSQDFPLHIYNSQSELYEKIIIYIPLDVIECCIKNNITYIPTSKEIEIMNLISNNSQNYDGHEITDKYFDKFSEIVTNDIYNISSVKNTIITERIGFESSNIFKTDDNKKTGKVFIGIARVHYKDLENIIKTFNEGDYICEAEAENDKLDPYKRRKEFNKNLVNASELTAFNIVISGLAGLSAAISLRHNDDILKFVSMVLSNQGRFAFLFGYSIANEIEQRCNTRTSKNNHTTSEINNPIKQLFVIAVHDTVIIATGMLYELTNYIYNSYDDSSIAYHPNMTANNTNANANFSNLTYVNSNNTHDYLYDAGYPNSNHSIPYHFPKASEDLTNFNIAWIHNSMLIPVLGAALWAITGKVTGLGRDLVINYTTCFAPPTANCGSWLARGFQGYLPVSKATQKALVSYSVKAFNTCLVAGVGIITKCFRNWKNPSKTLEKMKKSIKGLLRPNRIMYQNIDDESPSFRYHRDGYPIDPINRETNV